LASLAFRWHAPSASKRWSAKLTETPDSFVTSSFGNAGVPPTKRETDLPVGTDNVVELAAGGRARWKIENETFNVLKNNGYNLEHSFGHGKQNLAAILVSLNLLAFAMHTVCDIGDKLWRNARTKLGPRYNFFSKLAAITTYLIFPSWDDLLLTLAFAKPPPIPP
jgi:hypothetical protein